MVQNKKKQNKNIAKDIKMLQKKKSVKKFQSCFFCKRISNLSKTLIHV